MSPNQILKEISSFVIRYSGIPFLIRNTYAKTKVSIIKYHDPNPETLDKHLDYLAKRYRFIRLRQLVAALQTQDWSAIPLKSLVLTFDDGHKGNYDLLKIFKKYQVIPTVYLCSGIVNSNRHFWWKEIDRPLWNHIKKSPHKERLKSLEKHVCFYPEKEYSSKSRQALNYQELMEMKEFVDFQSHSRFHPILTTCSDEECHIEISHSRKDIESLLGGECQHFAYPNGDYTEREMTILKDAEYLSARTLDAGWNDLQTNPYQLRITGVTDDASINMLAAQLSGLPAFFRHLIKGSFRGKYKPITLEDTGPQ